MRMNLRFFVLLKFDERCTLDSFNQRARDSSSLDRTKIKRRIARFLVGFSFCTPFARSLHSFHITAGDHQLVGGAGMPQTMEHDAGELRVRMQQR